MFRKLDGGIERPHQAVFHDSGNGHGAMQPGQMDLNRRWGRIGGQIERRQLRFESDLLVAGSTFGTLVVSCFAFHQLSLSIPLSHFVRIARRDCLIKMNNQRHRDGSEVGSPQRTGRNAGATGSLPL
jgi:hypothetical protein